MSRMEELINEINHLAHKDKTIGLTPEEVEKKKSAQKRVY